MQQYLGFRNSLVEKIHLSGFFLLVYVVLKNKSDLRIDLIQIKLASS